MAAQSLLKAAGWYPGRDVGRTGAGIAELVEAGFPVDGSVERLLREYSDLTIADETEARFLWFDDEYGLLGDSFPVAVDALLAAGSLPRLDRRIASA